MLAGLACTILGMAGIVTAAPFLEVNGLVVMEIESAPVVGSWASRTTIPGYMGTEYYHCTAGTTTPGQDILNYEFTVAQAGNYQVQVRSRIAEGSSNTDANDSFIRLIDNTGTPVTPVPNDNVPTTTWYKFYQNTLNAWVWQTSNKDNDPKALGWSLSAGQTYKLQICRRAVGHAVDKIVLWNKSLYNYGDNTGRSSSGATLDALPESSRATGATNIIYIARTDFPTINTGEVPYYSDSANNALAIDASIESYRGKFARAVRTFTGSSGVYDVTITTLTELDGECTYRLLINGIVRGTYTNPATSTDYALSTNTWFGIVINNAETIAVESNTDSNGLIPEGGGFAWARGRWRQIALLSSTTSGTGIFDSSKDILIAHFDSKPDADDIMAQAALSSMLRHPDLEGVNYYAVLGAYGTQSGTFIDSSSLMDLGFGTSKWTNAHTDWNSSVTRVVGKVKPILQAGGKVFVQEAGQSDFTADWIYRLINNEGIVEGLIKTNVMVVQHSTWNENNTSSADLTYVKEKTDYRKIADGNDGGNGTPDYAVADTAYMIAALSTNNLNAEARALWTLADNIIDASGFNASYSVIPGGGVDFSDCVENWYIFDIGSHADSVATFWARYVTDGGTNQSPSGTVAAINCGGNAFTAADGTMYSADAYFTGGSTYTKADPIVALRMTRSISPSDTAPTPTMFQCPTGPTTCFCNSQRSMRPPMVHVSSMFLSKG